MKTIFTLLFLSITSLCFGQNVNGKEYRIFPRTDSVTTSNIGKIAFDADDDKLRFNDGVSWYSYIIEGTTLPYWPTSGNFSTTGPQVISFVGGGTTDFETSIPLRIIAAHDGFFNLGNITFGVAGETSPSLIPIKTFYDINGVQNTFTDDFGSWPGESWDITHTAGAEEETAVQIGFGHGFRVETNKAIRFTADTIRLMNPPPVLDTAAWVLVRENSSGEIKRRSASSIASSGAFMPLTGTGTQTGDVTISGSDNIGFGVTPTHKLHIQGGSDLLLIQDGDGTPVLEASVENGRPTITVGDINMVGDLIIDEGTNRIMGTATLSSGTVTVNTTKVTANSRIFLTVNGGTLTNVGTPYVSARSAGTSFTITSTNGSDASDVAWIIIEPAP